MTSNFDFLAAEWTDVHPDAVRAESYGRTDPRTAVFYARRVIEQVVEWIYDLENLREPYRDDLAARLADDGFLRAVGVRVAETAHAIRKVGNAAVHRAQPISEAVALGVLRELHRFTAWAATRYTTDPNWRRPAPFDAALVPGPQPTSPPPRTASEIESLRAQLDQRDAAMAAQRAERDDLQAELDALRAQIAAAQAAQTHPADVDDFDEADTRALFIDADLLEAGWDLAEARDREYPITGMPNIGGEGFVDYVLWGADGLPLAIIEAKRTRRDPIVGQQQAKLYADALERMTGRRPVIFFSNGATHHLWDDSAGYPPREVAGFLTRDELELMIQRRRTRLPLATVPVNSNIAGRHYQLRAVRAIDDALEARRRRALLVMATGSGKTRTIIALVDQLMKAGWVKRVLFLADRVALVNQAAGAFKTHLPDAATVNLVTEKTGDGRVFVATYPTMMNLVDSYDDPGRRRFGPGFFDLVVIDEAHRSVYAKYGALFSWFDAYLVGLTATPKDEVDRNTYGLFHLEDGVPTDAYSLDEAVAEGYLVPPVGVSVPLKFMRAGIHYDQLSEAEKEHWDSLEWSDDDEVPTDIDPEELNRWLFNTDTVDQALKVLMERGHRVAGGDRLGKTIIFAKNNDHAKFISERFDLAYPEFAGSFARIVTYRTEYAQSLIDDFSKPDSAPHIAISVDMLDTGIDVPEVVNLVFFKLVRSASKFWQMVGRGTRLSPDLFGPGLDKQNFYIFDFCMNLEYFNQPGAGAEGSVQKSLGQRLFEARLKLVSELDEVGSSEFDELRFDTAAELHRIVAGMNLDNFVVRPHRALVQKYTDASAWARLDAGSVSEIAGSLAGLPSTVRDDDEDAKRFDLIMLTLQLAVLGGDRLDFEAGRTRVQGIASRLLTQTTIPVIAAQVAVLADLAGDEWWVDVTLPMLEFARRRVRALVKFLPKGERKIVYTDLADELGESSEIELRGISVGTNWERFKAKARAYLREHEDNIALHRLRHNRQLTPTDLEALQGLLEASGAGTAADIEKAAQESNGLGLFVRSLVGLDRAAAAEAFSEFTAGSDLSADQLRFIELIIEHLTANGTMPARRLYEAPFTDFAFGGPEVLFVDADVTRLIGLLRRVDSTASDDPGSRLRLL
ncbi:DEAD/DEAH box helicase family protein [Propioniciclava sp. MC1683]|uniref:DEAD/DEAH box helicase family protein n=1 Tax=Propioniciclava sp. MC1683 TaxID=2760309 RepID=UPI0016007638|nr:DEAD/DEAH box helicase family protein [Propioniciclava sp. MC1683]MBB1502744.1 DEAD/DEAH box helicase family protein [Propioniciclava sp. MC1683]